MATNQYFLPDAPAILKAADRIKPYVNYTPVLSSSTMNRKFNANIFFKCENFQKTGAFKARGATNTVLSLNPEQIPGGVATHSSGNHAQALSWGATLVNTKAYIVMPRNSSRVQVEAVEGYGGKIFFCEPTLKAREETLKKVLKETNATEIHPYNDFRIIAGQATAALEMITDLDKLDIILVPVGGGGLLSGTLLSAAYFSPDTKVIAVEPETANDAWQSYKAKRFIPSHDPKTIADGLRTSLGSLTFPIMLKYVSDVITVSEEAIISSMCYIWERMKIIIEPSSAVPVAALFEKKVDIRNKNVGIIISGGNVDLKDLPWNLYEKG